MSSSHIARPKLRIGAALLFIAFGLVACGGGGDGGANGAGASAAVPAPAPVTAPAIVTQPAPQSAAVGGAVTFAVGVTGSDLAYQWRRDGKDIAGATAAGYTLTDVQAADDGAVFTVTVKNGAGSVVSTGAALQVAVPKGLSLLAGRPGGPGNLDGQDGRFKHLVSVTAGPAGLLYVTDSATWDYGPGTLRTVDPATGIVATVRTYTEDSDFPRAIRFDAAGNRYEMTTSAIFKVTTAGVRTLLAGSEVRFIDDAPYVDGTGAAARFGFMNDMAIDGAGNLYVADTGSGRIRKVDASGKVSTLAGGRAAATLQYPIKLAFDPAGNLLVVEASARLPIIQLRKVALDGTVTTPALKSADGAPLELASRGYDGALAIDKAGNIYLTDVMTGCRVRRIGADGTVVDIAGSAAATGNAEGKGDAARFCSSVGRLLESMTVDSMGNLIVLDAANSTIRRVTPAGEVTTVAGRAPSVDNLDGKGAAAAFFVRQQEGLPYVAARTYSLAADSQGKLFVGGGDRIRTVTTGGDVATLAWAANAGQGARYYPGGLAYGGRAIVVSNNVISSLDASGTLRFIAGRPGSTTSVDGTGAAATFVNPYDPIVDSQGNIYVHDVVSFTDSFIVTVRDRKITPEGVVTTLPSDYLIVAWHADRDGNVWAARSNGSVVKMGPDGTRTTVRAAPADQRGGPTAIARDAAGNLYLAELLVGASPAALPWHGIRKIAPDGKETIIAGTDASLGVRLGAPGSLNTNDALATGLDGIVYVMSENAVLRLKQ
jgi:hypothetical protein